MYFSRGNDVVMGTSSREPTSSLAANNDQGTPETSHPTGEQYQQRSEAAWVAYLDAVGKGKSNGKGKNVGKAGLDECSVGRGKIRGSDKPPRDRPC